MSSNCHYLQQNATGLYDIVSKRSLWPNEINYSRKNRYFHAVMTITLIMQFEFIHVRL